MMSPASISTQSVPFAPSVSGLLEAGLVQFFVQMRRHGGDLAVGEARRDDHAVGEAGAAGQVDDDDVLGLVILQAGGDDRLQPVELRHAAVSAAAFLPLRPGDGGLFARRAGHGGQGFSPLAGFRRAFARGGGGGSAPGGGFAGRSDGLWRYSF